MHRGLNTDIMIQIAVHMPEENGAAAFSPGEKNR